MTIDFASIRERVDLVELVTSHLGEGKRRGREHVWLCPFHGEKTPSFYVNGGKGSFYCFGCDAKGDALDFVRMIDGVTLEEALERFGQDTTAAKRRPVPAPVVTGPRRIAAPIWERLAEHDDAGEAYLKGRGLLCRDPEVLRFNVGTSGHDWLDEKAQAGYRCAFAVRQPNGIVQTISLRYVLPGDPPDGKKTLALLDHSTKGAAICQSHVLDLTSGDPEYAKDEVLIVEGGTSWLGAHIETLEAYVEGEDCAIWVLGAIGAAQAPGVATAFAAAICGRTVLVGLDEDEAGEKHVLPTAQAALAAGAKKVQRVKKDFGARRPT